jgi:hypothetical protein
MRDEFDSRLLVEHGTDFYTALAELFRQIKLSWTRLHEIQYEAPWRREC